MHKNEMKERDRERERQLPFPPSVCFALCRASFNFTLFVLSLEKKKVICVCWFVISQAITHRDEANLFSLHFYFLYVLYGLFVATYNLAWLQL